MCCGCQKLKKQTGGRKIHQVLLIQRYRCMLRKLVSCRLLDAGRTQQGKSLYAYPVPVFFISLQAEYWAKWALWSDFVQPSLLCLHRVWVWCHSGLRFQWASQERNGLTANKHIFLHLNFLLWSKSFASAGWSLLWNQDTFQSCNRLMEGLEETMRSSNPFLCTDSGLSRFGHF